MEEENNLNSKDTQNTFLKGSAWMTFGSIASRILGALYIIPWYAWMGAYGNIANALTARSYNIYTIFILISTAGIPGAIAKQVAKYNALNEDNDSKLLCNAMLNNAIKKFRKVYKDNYNTVIATISKMLVGEINNCMYDIWKEHNLYKLVNKYMIFDNPDIDMQHKAVMIVFKEYINARRESIQCNDATVTDPSL